MTQAAFTTGIAALLADATFDAAVRALLPAGVATPLPVLIGNRQVQTLAGQFPACWVVEQGDGRAAALEDDSGRALGGCVQEFEADLLIALVWTDQDPDTAAAAKQALPTLTAQLLLRNPQPGGIGGAWLAEWQSDRGGRHPTQVWGASIAGFYQIPRA